MFLDESVIELIDHNFLDSLYLNPKRYQSEAIYLFASGHKIQQ